MAPKLSAAAASSSILVLFLYLLSLAAVSAGPVQLAGYLRASSADPGVALGQQLSNSSNPDPLPNNRTLFSTGTPTPITDDLRGRINALSPYAAAIYCPSYQQGSPTGCGRPCNDLPGVEILYHAGDGAATPHGAVTYSPAAKSLTIAHDGTNFSHVLSILDDLVFVPVPPPKEISTVLGQYSTNIDPGPLSKNVNSSVATTHGELILVHAGFLGAWQRAYAGIFGAVQQALQTYPDIERLQITGHSLGACLATLDMIALRGAISKDIPVEAIIFASPRVGNPVFANLVDQLVSDPSQNLSFAHLVNSDDIVPHLAPLVLGYQHPLNEVFLPVNGSDQAVLCPGDENVNCALSRSLETSAAYHNGPYLGRRFGGGPTGDCSS